MSGKTSGPDLPALTESPATPGGAFLCDRADQQKQDDRAILSGQPPETWVATFGDASDVVFVPDQLPMRAPETPTQPYQRSSL